MQIKKAAEAAGLTERAVRLYEEKGLISPAHTDKNGRSFREYSDTDVEKLKTIASLRRALFTIDEIKEMEDYPDMIGEIVRSHRERMHTDFESLSYIINHIDKIDESEVKTTEELADAIFPKRAAVNEETGKISKEPTEEEKILFSEQYQKIYDKYFSENTGWERRYSASLSVSDFFGRITSGGIWRVCKFFIWIAVIGVIAYFILNGISKPEYFTYEPEAVIAPLYDLEDGEPIKIKVEGLYRDYLFRPSTMQAIVYVDGYKNASYAFGDFQTGIFYTSGRENVRLIDPDGNIYYDCIEGLASVIDDVSGKHYVMNIYGSFDENGRFIDIALEMTEMHTGTIYWNPEESYGIYGTLNGSMTTARSMLSLLRSGGRAYSE